MVTRCALSIQTTLQRDADAPKQVGEPGIRAKGITERLDFEISQAIEPLLVGLFKPSEGLVFFLQPGVDQAMKKAGTRLCFEAALSL